MISWEKMIYLSIDNHIVFDPKRSIHIMHILEREIKICKVIDKTNFQVESPSLWRMSVSHSIMIFGILNASNSELMHEIKIFNGKSPSSTLDEKFWWKILTKCSLVEHHCQVFELIEELVGRAIISVSDVKKERNSWHSFLQDLWKTILRAKFNDQ